jgi:diguanylate cyclase (GGDEF)-like protein/PAS domain S-box-containing protein
VNEPVPPPQHRQLTKQLRRLGLSPETPPDTEQWDAFLGRVSAAYTDADDDRYLMERSLNISSSEMADLYGELRRTSESRLAAEHARLLAVTEHSPIAIAEFDAFGRVLFANPAARTVVGRTRIGGDGTVFFLVHEADRQIVRETAIATWEDGTDKTIIVRSVTPDGRLRYLRARVRALREHDDQEIVSGRWFLAASDVTEEVEARASSERLTALLEAATDVVAVFDPSGELLHLNRVGCWYLGVSDEAELEGRSFFELFDPTSRDRVRKETLPTVCSEGTWSGEATLVGPDLSSPMSLVVIGHRGDDGELEYCSAIARDVTELKEVQHALAREATHDALTGLPNRALLLDRLNQAVLRAHRSGADLAVLYVDLDRVKIVNDSLGHEAGDRLLMEAARRLEACGRSLDTVGRLGGDEFVIVAQDLDGPRGGVRLAMSVVHAFNEPFDLEGTEAFVTASVGVAFRVQPDDSAATLLRDADVAMYRAKEAGGGRYELFDAEMRAWATDRFETETALRHAIERDELLVHYQPQVRPETGEIVGFEALARWDRSTTGPVSPAVFIPLAEETGLISVIGAYVLEHACREANQWTEHAGQPLGLAVNVSGRQLTQPGLLEVVERVLDVTGFDAKRLTLEITESVLVHDPALARTRLEALRELGVRTAIDDFGKGYSSLAYLQRFPIDVVKIDQVFVADLGREGIDTTIVASVIELAHALGFEVVAEGVEDDVQLRALIELGCDLVQGHVVSPALPPEAAMEFLDVRDATRRRRPVSLRAG